MRFRCSFSPPISPSLHLPPGALGLDALAEIPSLMRVQISSAKQKGHRVVSFCLAEKERFEAKPTRRNSRLGCVRVAHIRRFFSPPISPSLHLPPGALGLDALAEIPPLKEFKSLPQNEKDTFLVSFRPLTKPISCLR